MSFPISSSGDTALGGSGQGRSRQAVPLVNVTWGGALGPVSPFQEPWTLRVGFLEILLWGFLGG